MNTRKALLIVAAGAFALTACSGSNTPSDIAGDMAGDTVVDQDVIQDTATPDAATDVRPDDQGEPDVTGDVIEDATADAEPEIWYPPVTPPLPFGPENRGYVEKNGIVHVHSRWSHDGCFPDHEEITSADIEACATTYTEPGDIQACKDALIESMMVECVDEYRAAACDAGIDFMFQTDHPSDVRDQTFENALHFRPESGDQMFNDAQDRPVTNRIACPEGSAVDGFYIYFGDEGSKQMPIGMSDPVPQEAFNVSFDDYVDLATAQAAIGKVHDAGGWAMACHPEQGDLSVERIVELPLDIIEIFNFHPALMGILEDFEILFKLARFMDNDENAPNPDLSMMLVLKPVANDPIKFDAASKSIRLSHVLATDIHRNVELPKLCETAETCGDNWIETYPGLARLLATGGPAILGDGVRMDSYGRTLRWASNHALVAADGTDYLNIRDAIGMGRSYSAFDVMGIPAGFDFFAVADGEAVEMGREITGATDAKIYIRTPTIAKPVWAGTRFGDTTGTDIVTKLIRVDESGSQVVAEIFGQGWTYEFAVTDPAVYRVEVWMTPSHLATDLGDMSWMAAAEYPWIYSNALFFR